MINKNLLKPIDAASIGIFRVFFGAIMLWQCYRYFANDWINLFYIDTTFLFKYYGFSWIQPLPGNGMYWVFSWLALNSFLVMIGYYYRLAIFSLLVSFGYIFLLDEARYLNHFYLVLLLAFLMCFISADRAYSVDASRKKLPCVVPYWNLLILIIIMEIMLIYAGVVKIQQDWLNGVPLSLWLSARTDTPFIGGILDQRWVHLLASYLSIVIHLLGAPLLLFKKTRVWMFVAYAMFHGLNSIFFNIGIFPMLTIAATSLFLNPSWPRRFFATRLFQPVVFYSNAFYKTARAILGVFFVVQLLLPVRHFFYPGNVLWTDEGHKFAWRMKLREKNGIAAFYIRDPATGRQWTVDNSEYLLPRQIAKVATRPDLALQYAHFLAKRWQQVESVQNPDVRAWIAVSLNGRPPALLINPTINLNLVERGFMPADWIYKSEQDKPVD